MAVANAIEANDKPAACLALNAYRLAVSATPPNEYRRSRAER